MPSKVLSVLDATGSYFASGTLSYLKNPPSPIATVENFEDFISLEAPGSADMSFNVTPISTNTSGVANQMAVTMNFVDCLYNNFADLDYEVGVPVTGIPSNAKIKKLTYVGPWSCNIDFQATSTQGAMSNSDMDLTVFRVLNWGGVDYEFEFGPETNVGQNLVLVDSHTGVDATIVAFDYTGTEDFITPDDLQLNYNILANSFLMDTPTQWNYTINDAVLPGGNVQMSAIYLVSLHTGWTVTVEYEVADVTWELDSPAANRTVQPGNTIEFSSSGDDAIDFTQIETLTINGVTAIPTWDATTNTLSFVLPDFPEATTIEITMTSTQFEGSMPLQLFPTIYFENAPGIYTLVDGHTHDTYYNRISEVEGTEINTKIPNPTGRTGFY